MPVNLSIKNVPDALAQRLRERAAANGRSLQREMLTIIEAAADATPGAPRLADASPPEAPRLTIDQVYELAHAQFPNGTPSSVEFIRAQRDAGLSVDLGDWPEPKPRR